MIGANLFVFGIIVGMLIMYYRLKYLIKKTDWYFGCGKDKHEWGVVTTLGQPIQCQKCDKVKWDQRK